MSRLRKSAHQKIVSVFLVVAFILFDLSSAYPYQYSSQYRNLAVPSALQSRIIDSEATFAYSLLNIGRYLLGDSTGRPGLPLKYLEYVMSMELNGGIAGIDLSHVRLENGVVIIPCVRDGVRSIAKIADKNSEAAETMNGDPIGLSDDYVIKIVPADEKDLPKIYSSENSRGYHFRPKYNFIQGSPLDMSMIKTKRDARTVIELLKKAKGEGVALSVTGHLRGLDGPGSTLDAPAFQMGLTKNGIKDLAELPLTPTIASIFDATIRFELANDENAIEYIALDHGISGDHPYKVVVNNTWSIQNGQKDAAAFIFGKVFGLRGIRIVCEKIPSMALAGGMESSNVLNVSLIAAASMLSGADLSMADIFSLAVKLENDEFGGLTGGQGHLCCMLGGAYKHIWLSGVKDHDGNLVNPYSALSEPLLPSDGFRSIENHMMLVQAGKEYKDGGAVVYRTASLINNMWTDLLKDGDKVSAPLFREMMTLANQYVRALQTKDYETVVKTIDRYVDIRNLLCKRWMALMLDAHGKKDVPEYAKKYTEKVFGTYSDNKDYAFIKKMYEEYGDSLRSVSLYELGPISELVMAAREKGIAIMPLGAGGPGANLIAVSPKGAESLKSFLESHGLSELTEDKARETISGSGILKGYMPFKVGVESLRINGFNTMAGVSEPQLPFEGDYSLPDAMENHSAFTRLDEKINREGFFGAGVSATDRYEYIRSLMGNASLAEKSKYLSDERKEDMRKLSDSDRRSFARVANIILLDVLDRSNATEPGYSLPNVSGLEHMSNSPTILLVAPFENKELKAGSFLAPPLGIYRLANYLRLFGIKVDIFDPNLIGGKYHGSERLLEFVKQKKEMQGEYDFIGFSIYEPTLENDMELAKEVDKISGGSIIIAGGEGAFYNTEKLVAPGSPFSIIYKGFGEISLLDTLITYMQTDKKKFLGNGEALKIKGTIVKPQTGAIVSTPPQSPVSKNDYRVISLYFDSTIVPYEDYWRFMEGMYTYGSAEGEQSIDLNAIRTVRLITSSHCPMGCTFCSSTHFLKDSIDGEKQPVLSLAPQEIINILKNIDKYHPDVRNIFFNDDDFMINQDRVRKLCALIKEEFVSNRFRFIALGRIDKVDAKLLEKMKEAGFVQLNYGIESFSDQVLKEMNKGVTCAKNLSGLDLTLDSGIVPLINLILFYPTTTKKDVLSDMRTAVEYAARGAELSYWPLVEAFKGASIAKDVRDGKHKLSANGKDVLPDDAGMRDLAKAAVNNKAAVIKEIKDQYGIKGKVPHVVDVMAFFIAFYRAAGESTDRIEEVLGERLSGHVRQIKTIAAAHTRLNVITTERIDPGLILPQKAVDVNAVDEALADKELEAGRIGVITVAGGMSSRAGVPYPKGLHPIMPISDKTLFQARAEEIRAAADHYGKPIPWVIMTSDITDEATRNYFNDSDYFGLNRNNIIFVKAESVPARLSGTQELTMKDPSTILLTPSGHGAIYKAMMDRNARTDGGNISALDEAKRRGVETFIYCQVDNAMPVIHRQVLGAHLEENSEFTTVSVPKRDRNENLGMPVVSILGDKRFYVEYNQPGSETLKYKEGFDSGACGIFILARSLIERVDQPPYHIVRKKKSDVYKDGRTQQSFIDKYESFMFDVVAQSKKSINVLMPREECFAPFKNMEGLDSPETVAGAVSDRYKRKVKKVFPELEIPDTSIIELPASAEYMTPDKLREELLKLNFPSLLESNASLRVLPGFIGIDKKILDLSKDSRELSKKLMSMELSQYEKTRLKRSIMEKYREDEDTRSFEKTRYPRSEGDWRMADIGLARARQLYSATGRPVYLEGVTLIYRTENNEYGLSRKAIDMIHSWNKKGEEPLVATIALGSEHITLYDLACMIDWGVKYKNQFNSVTRGEIDEKTKALLSAGQFGTEESAREQATYEVITMKTYNALKRFTAERAPVFRPSKILISRPPCEPSAILLGMEPKTAEDLAIVTRVQDAIKDETGITNTVTFKAHVTLGYIVNSIYDSEASFDAFMRHVDDLNRFIASKRDLPECEFSSPQMELCYLDDLDNYYPVSTFEWDGTAKLPIETDIETKLAQTQRRSRSKRDHAHSSNDAPPISGAVKSSTTDERTKFIVAGNTLMNFAAAKTGLKSGAAIAHIDTKTSAAEIIRNVNSAMEVVDRLGRENVPQHIAATVDYLYKHIDQFEADGAIGTLIVLARKAQREDQKLIIGLETDWIPGMNVKGSLQRSAISALMKEIDSIGDTLRSMGLDNVEIVRGSGNDLSAAIIDVADKTHTNMRNVVVMASSRTINSESFSALRNAKDGEKPFLAGIDPSELIRFYSEFGEATERQLYIGLTGLLYMTLELAAGKEPPQTPVITSYDKENRIIFFLPKVEPIEYEALRKAYNAEVKALTAA